MQIVSQNVKLVKVGVATALQLEKKIVEMVNNQSMHPTNEDWYPSFDRGSCYKPEFFEDCECWECQMLSSKEREKIALWSWREGGRVACFLWTYDSPQYYTSNPKPNDDYYMARVSFWGLDDFGMEKSFQFEEDARWFVCHLPSYISKDFLWDHGFITC